MEKSRVMESGTNDGNTSSFSVSVEVTNISEGSIPEVSIKKHSLDTGFPEIIPNTDISATSQLVGKISMSMPAGPNGAPVIQTFVKEAESVLEGQCRNEPVIKFKSLLEEATETGASMTEVKKDRSGPSESIDLYCSNSEVGNLLVEHITYEEPDEPGPSMAKKKKGGVYCKDEGPCLYKVKGELVTPPIITRNLPAEFATLPIFGRPKNREQFPQFCKDKIRDFIGPDLTEEEFENLSKYCSPNHLKTGVEISMPMSFPTNGFVMAKHGEKPGLEKAAMVDGINLVTLKKLQLRLDKDANNMFPLKLKYRGIRMIPNPEEDKMTPTVMIGRPLEPGKDLVFRIRVYRPYAYNLKYYKQGRTRHSVFSCDVVMVGRQKLSLLRERIVCANDVGMRVDVSNNPDDGPETSAKDMFPSGFFFINNVFYVDTRAGCADQSAGLRAWAAARGLGAFPARDMCAVTLDEIVLKLGHPEVYMHQGNCEHLFTFSEVRLLGPLDPLRLSSYPLHTSVSQFQSVYCTTCAEFGAKWIVVACERVPFDPAFFCETCFKLYLYTDGRKIGNFKAYSYRGNELNMLKPQS